MSEKKGNNKAIVTGYMTIKKSALLPLTTKQTIITVPEGHVRKFRKILQDPATGEKVILEGRVYLSGCKDGKPVGDRKQSLTCHVQFEVENVESFVATGKVTDEETLKQELQDAMVAALTCE